MRLASLGGMRRFLPLEIFGVIHFFTIFSLFYAPWFFVSGFGYERQDIMISTGFGVVLAALALSMAIGGGIRFRTYLRVTEGLSAFLFVLAFLGTIPGTLPSYMFMVYAVLLIGTSLTVVVPQSTGTAPITVPNPRRYNSLGDAGSRLGLIRH